MQHSKTTLSEIRECFGLEGTFNGHLVQPPCNEKGHLQLDQFAQTPVPSALESVQASTDASTTLWATNASVLPPPS